MKARLVFLLFIFLLSIFTFISCNSSHTCEKGDWEVKEEATCSSEGIRVKKCIYCFQTMETESIARTSHILGGMQSETRNYENECPDYIHFKACKNCDYTEVLESVKVHDNKKVTTNSTCTTLGYDTYTCRNCGYVKVTNHPYLLPHSYSDEISCDSDFHWNQCRNCNSVKDKVEHIEDESGICTVCGTKTSYTDGVIYSLSNDQSYAIVTGYIGTNKRVRIMPEYNGVPVTHIGNGAFYGMSDLYSISLTSNITHIESDAFNNCPYLGIVFHMENVRHIGSNAFYRDHELDLSILPENLEFIGTNAFYYCSDLQISEIPDSVTYLGNSAFYHCQRIKSMKIGSGISQINDSVFDACYNLESVEFGENLISIGKYAFRECYYIESLVFPDELVSIGDNSFTGCVRLKSVYLGKAFEVLGDRAFSECYSFETISVNEENEIYTSIDGIAYTKNLSTIVCYPNGRKNETLVLPDGVEFILDYAFYGIAYLKNITLPESLVKIGHSAFRDCEKLKSVSINGATEIGDYAFSGCSSLSELNLCDKVTTIGEFAFQDGGFTELNIPDSVTHMGKWAFARCYYLEKLTVGSGLKSIPEGAFIYCGSYLETVVISEGVEAIGAKAFGYCHSLKMVSLPDSVVSIGDSAFIQCTSLSKIVIGTGLSVIEPNAFSEDAKLMCIFYKGTMESWDNILISDGNKEIKYKYRIYIYSETEPDTDGKFWNYGKDGSVVIW